MHDYFMLIYSTFCFSGPSQSSYIYNGGQTNCRMLSDNRDRSSRASLRSVILCIEKPPPGLHSNMPHGRWDVPFFQNEDSFRPSMGPFLNIDWVHSVNTRPKAIGAISTFLKHSIKNHPIFEAHLILQPELSSNLNWTGSVLQEILLNFNFYCS